MTYHDHTPRHDGWNPARQRAFLEQLAASGLVRSACAEVEMSREAAYKLRHRREGAAFALGWDAALLLARCQLADTLMERAIDGQTDILTRDDDAGERRRHRHDNRLAMSVLGRLDRFADGASVAATDALLIAGDWEAFLDLIDDGHGGAGAALFLAHAVRSTRRTTPMDRVNFAAPTPSKTMNRTRSLSRKKPLHSPIWSRESLSCAMKPGCATG